MEKNISLYLNCEICNTVAIAILKVILLKVCATGQFCKYMNQAGSECSSALWYRNYVRCAFLQNKTENVTSDAIELFIFNNKCGLNLKFPLMRDTSGYETSPCFVPSTFPLWIASFSSLVFGGAINATGSRPFFPVYSICAI